MRKPWLLLLCLLMLGCKTAAHRAKKTRPPDWEMPGATPPAMVALPGPAPAAVLPSLPTNGLDATWICLADWTRANGLAAPVQIAQDPAPTYALSGPNGVFVLCPGSETGLWDGMEVRLGFVPRLLDHEPCLHVLDLQKNLLPLLWGRLACPPAGARVIVLDPGHGGKNTGARSVFDGRCEKDLTLDWALRLAPLLQARGWRVFLTRTNDTEVSLADRVAIADRHQADLFLSLHFNTARASGDLVGVETYCLTPAGMPSNLTRSADEDPHLAYPNNAFDEANLHYAVRLHRALLRVNGHADRGIRRARFLGVLRGQKRPAVLIEGGYLSDPQEARRIADPAYRQRLAEALAQALE